MTVIFFCPNILRDAHRYIFQLDRLIAEGYDVILLDATKFYGNTATATEKVILEHKVVCAARNDFEKFAQNLTETPVLYITFDQYMKFAAPILNILVRPQDKLLTYHTKRFSSAHLPSNSWRKRFDEWIKKADKVLPLHYFKSFYKWRHKLFIPDYYLCSTEFLIPTKVFFTVKRDHRIVVHSDDINQVVNNTKPALFEKGKKVGVFLDQVIPFQDRLHPLLSPKIPKEYIDTYYRNLENTLKALKEELNLDEVIIALHPDAKKLGKELADRFQDFRTFIGATNELIRDSTIVFGHSSTVLGLAIYYKKPVILMKDNFILKDFHLIRDFIRSFEKDLGFKVIAMDQPLQLETDPFTIDEKKYQDYTRKFLKDNDIKENSFFYAIEEISRKF